MKKQVIISTLLVSCLLLCSFSTAVPSSAAGNHVDWYDGTFQGVWTKKKDDTSGSLWGVLNQGRRATRGTFSGEWNISGTTDIGSFRGIFYGKIVIVQCDVERNEKTTLITGVLRLNETHFSAQLFNVRSGVIEISGIQDVSFLPRLTGSYGIGVKSMHLIDENRPENFTTNSTDVREMMVQLWYPIETGNEGTRTEYMDYPTFQWLKGRSPIPLITIPNNAYLFVRPHGRNHTTIAAGLFPVVIFSPGYDGVYQIYTSFIEDLVSHGFVVATINHPYVSGITVFPDGRTVGPIEPTDLSLRTIVQDAKFVLDTITQMNATDPDFSGHFDLSKVGMYGHSYGGANTAVCCYEDSRFRTGLTLDGVFYQAFIPGNITVPFLFMFQEHPWNNSINSYMWNHTINNTFKMNILGSTHYAFTDVGVLLSHLVPVIPPRLLSFGSIPPKRMVNITRSYVTTFFEVYLKETPIEMLLNLSTQFNEVQFEYKLG